MATSKIQNNIRRLRFNAEEMTQQQLADKVQVSRQTIVAIEKGNYSPSLELAFKLARIFNTPHIVKDRKTKHKTIQVFEQDHKRV